MNESEQYYERLALPEETKLFEECLINYLSGQRNINKISSNIFDFYYNDLDFKVYILSYKEEIRIDFKSRKTNEVKSVWIKNLLTRTMEMGNLVYIFNEKYEFYNNLQKTNINEVLNSLAEVKIEDKTLKQLKLLVKNGDYKKINGLHIR